jgi:membrane protein DedA with SNARE-associated domain
LAGDHVFLGVSPTDASLLTMFLVAVIPLAPTEPVLTTLGVLAATGHGSPVALIAVSAIGCSISDHILYGLGRFGGSHVPDRLHRRASSAAAIEWLGRNSNRWGIPILIAGRWLPAGGTVGAVLAGTLRWRLTRFTPTSLVGSTLWSGYVVLLGYLGGTVAGQPLAGMALSLGVAALLGATTSVILQRGHRRRLAREDRHEFTEQPV